MSSGQLPPLIHQSHARADEMHGTPARMEPGWSIALRGPPSHIVNPTGPALLKQRVAGLADCLLRLLCALGVLFEEWICSQDGPE